MSAGSRAIGAPFLLLAALTAQVSPTGPANLRELVERGKSMCLAHDWTHAIEVLSVALALDADDVEARRWRGHAFTGSERPREALADLERAAELAPEDAWTCYARAMALHHLGEHERAIAGYTE